MLSTQPEAAAPVRAMTAISLVKLLESGEVVVVVREIEPVLLYAGKDQKVGERSGHTCRPSTISESDGVFPDR